MLVLGIESSCDETGLALYDSEKGLLGHALYSQTEIHAEYGGVVPELASRDHIRKLIPLFHELMDSTGAKKDEITAVAYTRGPGLMGALLVGAGFARSLAWSLDVPALGIHHLEGHLLAPMLEDVHPEYPFVALLVSGGHTQLVEVDGLGQYKMLGQSLDDAAGEAFDKTAKLLGLPYPGGKELAELAEQGDPKAFNFPRPMTDRPGLDFSFSGLKTHALTTIRKHDESHWANIAASFQQAIVDTLVIKSLRALDESGADQLVVAGGVSANRCLRETLTQAVENKGGKVFFPRLAYCGDNGAMIAYAGYLRLCRGERDSYSFDTKPRWLMVEN